jgi:hypothetical protein
MAPRILLLIDLGSAVSIAMVVGGRLSFRHGWYDA